LKSYKNKSTLRAKTKIKIKIKIKKEQKTKTRGAAEAPRELKQIPAEETSNNNNHRTTEEQALTPTLHPQTAEGTTPANPTGDQAGGTPTQTDVGTGNSHDQEEDNISLWLLCRSVTFSSTERCFLSWKHAGMVLFLPPPIDVLPQSLQ